MFMRNCIFLILAVLVLPACNEGEKTASAGTGEQNVQLIRRYFDHFNRYEWDQLAQMYAPRAVFLDPSMGSDTVVQTRAEIVAKYAELQQFIGGLRDSVVHIDAVGPEKVLVEFTSTGKDTSGKDFRLPICTVFTIRDGKIISDHTYYDN